MASSITNTSLNLTLADNISTFDTRGAIIYIVCVIIWYAIGFGLILIDDINPQPGRIQAHKDVSVYRTVYDLREQQIRNDILVELKDLNRRKKLWQIYYGIDRSHPTMDQKDKRAVDLIEKKLSELSERQRQLRYDLHDVNDDEHDDNNNNNNKQESDTESSDNAPTIKQLNEHTRFSLR